MVEKLLELARRKADAAEVHLAESESRPVQFESNDLKYVNTKSSRVLRDGLAAFNRQFVDKYAQYIDKGKSIDVFSDAKKLVESCFAFIPEFS